MLTPMPQIKCVKNLFFILTALLLLCMSTSVCAFAETRNIYVGDIITMEITSHQFSEEELRQKFKDFEMIELKKMSEGYLLSIRTFDVGEHTILLGDKEIVITVASTLNDMKQDGIFEGEIEVMEPGFHFHWRILFYIAVGVFVLSGSFALVKTLLKRKTKPESPYQLFLRCTASLIAEEDNYFVDLTFYFKEYLENLHGHRMIGKTSVEIVNQLKELSNDTDVSQLMLSDIHKWLTECDRFKFTGAKVSSDEKRRHYMRLLSLVEEIEKNRCDIEIKMNQYDINGGTT